MCFINSPLFAALIGGIATFATGLIAIAVYLNQKKDEKVNAATTILFEIRNAETQVSVISEKLHSNNTQDLPSVLPTNSWRKYSHLFAKDFDEDELKLLNIFYNSCENIESLANKQNNFIWIAAEERARAAQMLLGQIHLEFQTAMASGGAQSLIENQKKFEDKKTAVTKYFTDENYFYTPNKPIHGLKFQIESFQRITATTCGARLKKLANV